MVRRNKRYGCGRERHVHTSVTLLGYFLSGLTSVSEVLKGWGMLNTASRLALDGLQKNKERIHIWFNAALRRAEALVLGASA